MFTFNKQTVPVVSGMKSLERLNAVVAADDSALVQSGSFRPLDERASRT